jgi:GTPase SAR1 family protein
MEQAKVVSGNVAADHLDFAERLLGMFSVGDTRLAGWRERIARARQRLADIRYYLAVIGEFNAGKSTFINALLEAELFAASARPTTGAAVRVRYGQRFVVRTAFRDGRAWTSAAAIVPASGHWPKLGKIDAADEFGPRLTTQQICRRLSELDGRDALRVVTSDPTVTPGVKSVEVEFPAPLLRTGLVLIDTPGAESGDKEHGEEHARVAREAVSDADAAVVITSQAQLLPESLARFLAEALDSGLLARCAFVVTRADQADDSEFAALCQNVLERITAMLGLADPAVAWAAPVQVVRGLRGEQLDEDARVWVARFDRTRRWLRRIVAERRPAAVADTALRLIQELLGQLDSGLAENLRSLEQRQRELAGTAPADMGSFLAGRVKTGIRALDDAELAARDQVRSLTWDAGWTINNEIETRLGQCGSSGAIREVLADDMPSMVDAELRSLARQAQGAAEDELNSRLDEVTGDLRSDFAAEYAKLERIDAAPMTSGLGQVAVATATTQSATFAAATAVATADSQRDAMAFGGGVAAGAVIGSMIFPVVGTVIGGVLGGIFGSIFSESISTVRGRAIDAAKKSAGELVETTGDRLADAIGELAEQARDQLRAQADWYRSAYTKAVRAMREAHEAQQAALRTQHDQLTRARQEATKRSTSIAADRARLLSVSQVDTTDPFGGSDD